MALSDQNANNYESQWAISTYDNPAFVQSNGESIVTALRVGMTGLGYAPSQDVDQQQPPAFPDPNNPYQQKCVDIITAAGAVPPDNLRTNWKNALQYCDGAMFLKAALDTLPGADEVTGEQFKEAVGAIGGTYGSSLTFSSQWGPGVYAGTNGAQTLEWDESCLCFTYTSETRTFGSPATAGTPGTPAAPSATPTITIDPA